MRISDWSSDVCSSDLILTGDALANELRGFFDRPTLSVQLEGPGRPISPVVERPAGRLYQAVGRQARVAGLVGMALQIGRASCRERVWQYVYISVVAVSFKKKKKEINHYRTAL